LGAAQVGRLYLDLTIQGFETYDGTSLHSETASGGLLHEIATQALIESAEQRQSDRAKDISNQGIETQTLVQKPWHILHQGLTEFRTGIVDRLAVSWFHGNVLQFMAAGAAIGLDSKTLPQYRNKEQSLP
jgi:hypothetical protein